MKARKGMFMMKMKNECLFLTWDLGKANSRGLKKALVGLSKKVQRALGEENIFERKIERKRKKRRKKRV